MHAATGMTAWRPTSGVTVARRRADILQRLRGYFATYDVLEVDTPALSVTAVSDVQIESIAAHSTLSRVPLYLHTSPEFCMKRLLAAGYPDIYSICRVFRDGEAGARHQPEFTLLEWYRHDFSLGDIIQDTLRVIATALGEPAYSRSAIIRDYCEAFRDTVGVDPLTAGIDELATAAQADSELRASLGENRSDWLDLLLATRVAPAFPRDAATVLRHYPAGQAALARLCPEDSQVADRFEVFIGGLELANGYVELTDASIQADRFANDQLERRQRGYLQRPQDQALLAALQHGLPPCAGVALGLERLQMIHENTDDIRNVIAFPFEGIDEPS
tara:strand:+ start:13319 stop:14314 length:996 start_codon:yes stop_codon:yes gene_type:complete